LIEFAPPRQLNRWVSSFMKRVTILLASIALVIVVTNASLACVCNVRSLSKRVRESRAVFVGTVTSRAQVTENGQTLWRNQFTVERYWKGVNSPDVIVYTTLDDCASTFSVDGKYLVLAYFVKDAGHLETDTCMRTGPVEMLADDLAKLGKGKLVAKRNAHFVHGRNPTNRDASGGGVISKAKGKR
jgi:hypothetical protein